jgi:hypothetical protein
MLGASFSFLTEIYHTHARTALGESRSRSDLIKYINFATLPPHSLASEQIKFVSINHA